MVLACVCVNSSSADNKDQQALVMNLVKSRAEFKDCPTDTRISKHRLMNFRVDFAVLTVHAKNCGVHRSCLRRGWKNPRLMIVPCQDLM